jgi:signal transduction histidine kinase
MKRNLKTIESIQPVQAYRGAYQEVAVYVRDLLKCDYALVAVAEKESIRIQGFAGPYSETYENLATDAIKRLLDWGPVVIDDARLIAAPVSFGGQVVGLLIGYASISGTFTAGDLEKLMAYSHVAAGILTNAAIETKSEMRTTFTTEELFHHSRLITMGQLSACFAHEVRNPLMLINGHLRFIQDSLAPDHPLRTNLEVIERSARRIEDMAKRMLDFGKKKTRRLGRCDIGELISDALRFVQPYFRSDMMDVQVSLESQSSLILVDRWQMVQAIVNLLQNAADAMEDVNKRVLSITAGVEPTRVRIVISDTGTGIPKEILSKIFKPFFTTKGDRGNGLGLYIAKQVIEEHRGTIDVQTNECGTSFVISLPL